MESWMLSESGDRVSLKICYSEFHGRTRRKYLLNAAPRNYNTSECRWRGNPLVFHDFQRILQSCQVARKSRPIWFPKRPRHPIFLLPFDYPDQRSTYFNRLCVPKATPRQPTPPRDTFMGKRISNATVVNDVSFKIPQPSTPESTIQATTPAMIPSLKVATTTLNRCVFPAFHHPAKRIGERGGWISSSRFIPHRLVIAYL